MAIKDRLGVPKGMRDFSPAEKSRRDYIFDTIRGVFSRYGYQPLETPAMEKLDTLLGKYGDEGDRLLYRVLNSGDFLKGIPLQELEHEPRERLASRLCDKGMRYDLTVPLARYVAEHWQELPRPFKRYQLAPVWRADRPQRGRYREFYQCDVDIVGSDSLLCEVELMAIVTRVFSELGIRVDIRVNNRKLLAALALSLGAEESLIPLTVAIDKLDKIGVEGVLTELEKEGFTQGQRERIAALLAVPSGEEAQFEALESCFHSDPRAADLGAKGVSELRELLAHVEALGIGGLVSVDLSLARGLNYYTGAIFEVRARDVTIGSICGGGRYDNLTGIFGLEGVSGVGISFGADRIYDCLEELKAFPARVDQALDLLMTNLSPTSLPTLLSLAETLRNEGFRCACYPDTAKLKKQLDYANRLNARWVVMCGEQEQEQSVVLLKNMSSGEQFPIPIGPGLEGEILIRLMER